jgi:hypothetical protein
VKSELPSKEGIGQGRIDRACGAHNEEGQQGDEARAASVPHHRFIQMKHDFFMDKQFFTV